MTARRPRGAIQAFTPGLDVAPPLQVGGLRCIHFSEPFTTPLAGAMRVLEDEIHARRALGNRAALAVLEDDAIACYGWISYDAIRIVELAINIPIPRGHAYIWDCVTLPPYRGRRIFPALLHFMVEDLRRQAVVQIWAAVAPGNEASIHAFARAGFRQVAETNVSIGHFEAAPTAAATEAEATVLRSLRVSP